jgi:hypothetical protein
MNCCSDGCLTCFCAFCGCGQCLLASTRQRYDTSNWCFNCCCLSPAVGRSIIREGLNDCIIRVMMFYVVLAPVAVLLPFRPFSYHDRIQHPG